MKKLHYARKSKPSTGQMSLIGDVFDYKLKYQPHKSQTSDGQAVVVLRLPSNASQMDRRASMQEMYRLAGRTQSDFSKKEFWRKRARDNYRRQQIVANSTIE